MKRARTDAAVVPLTLVPDQLLLSALSLRFVVASGSVVDDWTREQLERIACVLEDCRRTLDG